MAGAARPRGLAPGAGQWRWTGEFSASTSGEHSLSSYTPEAAQKAFGPMGLRGLVAAHFTPWRAGCKAQLEIRPALLAALGAAGW
jgi:hypothetical protein